MIQCRACGDELSVNDSFCGNCQARVPPEDPANVATYEEFVKKFMTDNILEDYESQELARLRGKYAITDSTHARILADYEFCDTQVIEVAVDEVAIEGFAVAQRCLVRLQVRNIGEGLLVDTPISYRMEGAGEVHHTRTEPIPPGEKKTAWLEFTPSLGGQYQLQVLIGAAGMDQGIVHYRSEPLPFMVGKVATGPQTLISHTNLDMRGARASMATIGDTAAARAPAPAAKTGGILDQARWRRLRVFPVSSEEIALWSGKAEPVIVPEEAPLEGPTQSWQCPEEWALDVQYETAKLRWRKAGRTLQTHLVPHTIMRGGKSSEVEIPLHLMPDGDVPGTEAYKLTNQISREHFMFRYEGDRVRILDLDSSFGTHHSRSGDLRPHRPTTVRDGDRIILSPRAPDQGHRFTGTDGILEMRVEVGERDQASVLGREDEEAVRRGLDDVHALDEMLLGPDKPGRLNWVRISRVSNGPEEEYVMHLGAVSIGPSRDSVIRVDHREHQDEPPAELVWQDGAMFIRNPGGLPVRVGSKAVTQGLMCPLADRDVIEIGDCEIEVSVASGASDASRLLSMPTKSPASPQTQLYYAVPGGHEMLTILEIARRIAANPNADHKLWQTGWSGWKPWREVPEVVEAIATQTGHML